MKRRVTTTMLKRLRKHATVRAPRYHLKKSGIRMVSCPNETWTVQEFHKEEVSDRRKFDPWRSVGRPTTFAAAFENMTIMASISTA
jgi:hypothetical protein